MLVLCKYPPHICSKISDFVTQLLNILYHTNIEKFSNCNNLAALDEPSSNILKYYPQLKSYNKISTRCANKCSTYRRDNRPLLLVLSDILTETKSDQCSYVQCKIQICIFNMTNVENRNNQYNKISTADFPPL